MERRGNYVYGTKEEISAFKDQQVANAVTGVLIAVPVLAAVGAIYALKESKESAEHFRARNAVYIDAFRTLRGEEKAAYIESGSRKKALAISIIMVILPPLILIIRTVGTVGSGGTPTGVAAVLLLLYFAALYRYVFPLIQLKVMQSWGMKQTNKASCPKCGTYTDIIGFGQCRKCFGFFNELTPVEARELANCEMPRKFKTWRINPLESTFFTHELAATMPPWTKHVKKIGYTIGFILGFGIILAHTVAPFLSNAMQVLIVLWAVLGVFPSVAIFYLTAAIINRATNAEVDKFLYFVHKEITSNGGTVKI